MCAVTQHTWGGIVVCTGTYSTFCPYEFMFICYLPHLKTFYCRMLLLLCIVLVFVCNVVYKSEIWLLIKLLLTCQSFSQLEHRNNNLTYFFACILLSWQFCVAFAVLCLRGWIWCEKLSFLFDHFLSIILRLTKW